MSDDSWERRIEEDRWQERVDRVEVQRDVALKNINRVCWWCQRVLKDEYAEYAERWLAKDVLNILDGGSFAEVPFPGELR